MVIILQKKHLNNVFQLLLKCTICFAGKMKLFPRSRIVSFCTLYCESWKVFLYFGFPYDRTGFKTFQYSDVYKPTNELHNYYIFIIHIWKGFWNSICLQVRHLPTVLSSIFCSGVHGSRRCRRRTSVRTFLSPVATSRSGKLDHKRKLVRC